jgi:glycosyltransferase involved in cell wall biosynthesis
MTLEQRRRLRVLLVGPSLGILGGQAVQAQRLLKGFADSAVLDASFLAVNPQLPGILGRLQRIKYVRTIVTSIAYVLALLRHVPRTDVVHAFSASYFSYLLAPLPALVAARVFGKPGVLNYRSGEADDHLQNWPFSRWTMSKLATAVVVPSGYLVAVFGRVGIPARAIPNFVPVDRLPYRRRTAVAPRILSNRNFEALYDIECSIRAFAVVQARYPDASLTLVGEGSRRESLELLSKSLRLRNVTFVGSVPNSDMGRLYDSCDVYVNSPYIDNMPSSILEAFACGLPVATTDAGGIPYVIRDGENGLLVPARNPLALGAALLRLLDEPALALHLADTARQECLDRYVWPQVRASWEQCYQSLASDPARRE